MIIKNYTIAGGFYSLRNYGDGWDVINTKTGEVIEEGCSYKDAIECIYEDALGYVPVHYLMEV